MLEGKLTALEPDSFAAQAGLSVGNMLTLLNGQPFTSMLLRDTIRASKTQASKLVFQVDGTREVKFDYLGGERLALLERVIGTQDRLSTIFLGAVR